MSQAHLIKNTIAKATDIAAAKAPYSNLSSILIGWISIKQLPTGFAKLNTDVVMKLTGDGLLRDSNG